MKKESERRKEEGEGERRVEKEVDRDERGSGKAKEGDNEYIREGNGEEKYERKVGMRN